MTAYLSDKIKIISFFSILLVVFLHAYNLENAENPALPLYFGSALWCIEDFISYGLTRIAVPLFFLFSGFLFFLGKDDKIDFAAKIRKRFRTLFVPFLLWSLLGIAFYFTLQSIPQTAVFFTKERIADFTPQKWLLTVFVHPIPYQLWFIRDLMLLVLLSPLWYYALKYLRIAFFIPVVALWVYVTNDFQNSIEALLYFCLGGYLSLFRPQWPNVRFEQKAIGLVLVWLGLLALKTALLRYGSDALLTRLVFKLSIVAGILASWGLYDRISGSQANKDRLLQWCGFTFFIYAAHEPILTIFKKVLLIVFGKTSSGHAIVYFAAPVMAILAAVFIGFVLRKYFTVIYETLTGGR